MLRAPWLRVLVVCALGVLCVQGEDATHAVKMADNDVPVTPETPRQLADDAVADDASDDRGSGGVMRGYKKMAQTILPLLVGFKATGLLVAAMAVTKFVLLKALFLSMTALAIAALLGLKKVLSHVGMHQQHQHSTGYTLQHQDLSHMPYLQHEYLPTEPAQVTYIGGSYGLQGHSGLSGPTAAQGVSPYHGLAHGLDHAGSAVTGVVADPGAAAADALQLQQWTDHRALLAHQLQLQQQMQLHQQNVAPNHTATQLSRRASATTTAPYPYRATSSRTQ